MTERSYGAVDVDERIHSLTTIVESHLPDGTVSQGTGFFFHVLGEKIPEQRDEKVITRPIQEIWIITNRHVVAPGKAAPDSLSFLLRAKGQTSGVEWLTVTLPRDELVSVLRYHPNPEVNIAAIDVTRHAVAALKSGTDVTYSGVGEQQFPEIGGIDVSVASDVIIVGYPKGYYDKVNKFPIVKSGIVASRWKSEFDGKPAFLIDAKLSPGSSGSVVLAKPADFKVKDGALAHSAEKIYCILGIFSGEPYELASTPIETDEGILFRKERFDLGLVWYYYLIPEAIKGVLALEEETNA